MKVSVITTLRNESKNLDQFIHALLKQSKKIDELVICDGDSTDNTKEIIKTYTKQYPFIRMVIKKGGISVGRNEAIRNAKFDLIAVTDAGTLADPGWLQNLTDPFEKNKDISVVGGLFKITPKSDFERVSATQMLSDHDNINPETWLPSSRSIAFRKSVWDNVGGYPEYLPFAGEDTVFDINIKKAGYKIYFAPEAIVYWRPRSNIKLFYKQYFNYAYGDGFALTHIDGYIKRILIYTLGIILLNLYWPLACFLAMAYLLKKGLRVIRMYPKANTVFISILVTITNDIAEILGFTKGLLSGRLSR